MVAIWPTAILNVNLLQIFWAFSIYLEAVAILPQLVLLQRSGNVDNLAGQYVFFLGYAFFLYLARGNSQGIMNLAVYACMHA